MLGFSATILDKNRDKNDEIAIIDQNGKRSTTWKEFRKLVLQFATFVS